MDTFIVYKITCLKNDKLYIGYTSISLKTRLRGHFKTARSGKNIKFANAIRKYGEINFKIEELFTFHDKQLALLKEIELIKFYDTIKNGYNTSYGGEGGGGNLGRSLSIEHKQKISKSNKGKKFSELTKKKISDNHADIRGVKNPFFGKSHSKETKEKIGNRYYKTGKEHHLYKRKQITSFKAGKDHPLSKPVIIAGIKYDSLSQASKSLNLSVHLIKKLYINDV